MYLFFKDTHRRRDLGCIFCSTAFSSSSPCNATELLIVLKRLTRLAHTRSVISPLPRHKLQIRKTLLCRAAMLSFFRYNSCTTLSSPGNRSGCVNSPCSDIFLQQSLLTMFFFILFIFLSENTTFIVFVFLDSPKPSLLDYAVCVYVLKVYFQHVTAFWDELKKKCFVLSFLN